VVSNLYNVISMHECMTAAS